MWQRNVRAHASSAATRDNHYWYDGLRQVTRHDRGDLMPASGPPYTGIEPSTRRQMEVFAFDETGNWPGYFSQTPPLAQGRGHDRANQIISITGPAGVVQPAYDPAGNMTRMPRPGDWSAAADLTWDAWNRLVRIRDHSSSSSSASSSSESSSSSSSHSSSPSSSSSSSSSSDSSSGSSSSSSIIESSSSHSSSSSSSSSLPSSSGDSSASESSSDSSSSSGSSSSSLASSGSYHSASSSSGAVYGDISYQYDARTRRTRKSNGAETRDYYYDSQWRTIEERVAGSVAAQYVWSPLDRWTMICRKRGGEELYVLKDHLDPAAIIDTGGTVVERFGYDAFGPARFMDAAFTTLPASNADWNFLFHAEFLDTDSGLYNYGYRYYNPQLGRWLSRDPIGEAGGINLYGFVKNIALVYYDYLGLDLKLNIQYGAHSGFFATYHANKKTEISKFYVKGFDDNGNTKLEIDSESADPYLDNTEHGTGNHFDRVPYRENVKCAQIRNNAVIIRSYENVQIVVNGKEAGCNFRIIFEIAESSPDYDSGDLPAITVTALPAPLSKAEKDFPHISIDEKIHTRPTRFTTDVIMADTIDWSLLFPPGICPY